ncbi:conjugal transfer protein TrbF [Govanella unica]|uniref:Conjugal transfer protein TrbF n=1 Tax=Govanella unica TaxID=2975056 RepID=A0A9X3Z782_9PROT|nr:conjugal transfer protein TrbF [Govania unica]MDA5193714.1 conjugal transfer protein TrbF [Govania unica]
MMFKRSPLAYGKTPVPVTPYQKAAQVWDERMGAARLQAHNWRLMAFGCLGLAILLSGGVLWQTGRSSITPYIVELDGSGDIRAVAPATAAYNPTDAQIAFHLARFIENIRSLSTDPVIVRRSWLAAYDYAAAKASNRLNEYAREHDPFRQVGKRSITAEVTSVVRSSDDSFDIRWREESFENGLRTSSRRYRAVLSIVISPPRDEQALRKNPLGIYVHALDWSEDHIAGDQE